MIWPNSPKYRPSGFEEKNKISSQKNIFDEVSNYWDRYLSSKTLWTLNVFAITKVNISDTSVFRNDENEKNITNLSKSNRKYELTENFYSIGFTSIT